MSIYDIEGFDLYDNADQLQEFRSINKTSNIYFYLGRNGGQYVRLGGGANSGTNNIYFHNQPSGTYDASIGFAFKCASYSNGSGWAAEDTSILMYLYGSDTFSSINMRAGGLQFGKKTGTFIGNIASIIIRLNCWYFIEAYYQNMTSTTDECFVNINGRRALTVPVGTNMTNSEGIVPTIALSGPEYRYNSFDDVYLCSSPEDFMGDVAILNLYPNGNGNQSDWVGSDDDSTDNYVLVDQFPADTGIYIASSGTGDIDLWSPDVVYCDLDTVYGIQTSLYSQKLFGGSRDLAHILRINSTNYQGSGVSVVSDPNFRANYTFWDVNPDTSSAWLQNDINDLEFGVTII